MESGRRASESDGMKFLRHEAGNAVFALGSGNHVFTSN